MTALVVGLITVAAPADASASYWWRFVERPAGFPATADPALRLASADATLDIDETGAFAATVVLGAIPGEAVGTTIRIALGQSVDGSCVTDWEQTVPAFAPGGPATRDGDRILVGATIGSADYENGCGSVSLVSAEGTVLDRLEAPHLDLVIADPGGRAAVTAVSNRAVDPGRWSTVWLRIEYDGNPADGLRLSGSSPGRGVIVRQRTYPQRLVDGDRLWVPVRVRLLDGRAHRVTFRAWPFGDLAFPDAVSMTVRLKPTR